MSVTTTTNGLGVSEFLTTIIHLKLMDKKMSKFLKFLFLIIPPLLSSWFFLEVEEREKFSSIFAAYVLLGIPAILFPTFRKFVIFGSIILGPLVAIGIFLSDSGVSAEEMENYKLPFRNEMNNFHFIMKVLNQNSRVRILV